MSEPTRPGSEMGFYHLILRGNGKQIIFEERADYIHFLHSLKQYSSEEKISINAFCLMENHVHLLVYDKEQNIPRFMKRLAGNYALWFNRKYCHSGHLFENRYTCKAIESEIRLCRVFRYILNNPKQAGICPAPEYPWSSYGRYANANSFVDTSPLVELLGSFEEYAAYIAAKDEDEDVFLPSRVRDDEWAMSVIREVLEINSGTDIRTWDRSRRNEAIRLLKHKGLTIRQIERLTGIGRGIIQRIT